LCIFPSKVAKFQEKQSCCWRTCHRVWIYVKCCVHTSHAYYFCNILVSVKLHAIVSQAMFLWCTSNKPWHFYQKYQFGLIFFYPNYASKFFHQPIKGESNNCWTHVNFDLSPTFLSFAMQMLQHQKRASQVKGQWNFIFNDWPILKPRWSMLSMFVISNAYTWTYSDMWRYFILIADKPSYVQT